MECPKCGAKENELDWWIDNDGYWNWNCFACGHEWKIHQDNMKKESGK